MPAFRVRRERASERVSQLCWGVVGSSFSPTCFVYLVVGSLVVSVVVSAANNKGDLDTKGTEAGSLPGTNRRRAAARSDVCGARSERRRSYDGVESGQ